ncbi:MAG TPA: flagellin, partial [Thermoguttaceae bacterium]
MTRINTNVSSLTAQQSLAKSNSQLQSALTRLSTGLRINSGKDDPAGLIASEMLRSDIVSTQKAISNTNRANQVIATADSAIGQISALLNDIRGLVTEAANEGAMSPDQIVANQLQVNSSLESINRIAGTTSFQGRKLLDGSLGFSWTTTDANMEDYVSNVQIQQSVSNDMDVDIVVNSAAEAAELTADVDNSPVDSTVTVAISATATLTVNSDAGGSILNGARVRIVESSEVALSTDAWANYDATGKVLTINVSDSVDTDAVDLAAAINALQWGAPLVDIFDASATGAYDQGYAYEEGIMNNGSDGGLADSLVLQITGSKGSQVFQFDTGTSAEGIVNALEFAKDSTGVTASTLAGTITFNSTDYGLKAKIRIEVLEEGTSGTFGSSLSGTEDTGVDADATIGGYAAIADGNNISVNTSLIIMSATIASNTPDDTTASFSITGGGAMFQLGPDVISSQQVLIGIDAMNTGTLGGNSGRLFELGSGNDAALATDANTAALIVNEAINKITTLRGRLGAFQKTALQTNAAALGDTL